MHKATKKKYIYENNMKVIVTGTLQRRIKNQSLFKI